MDTTAPAELSGDVYIVSRLSVSMRAVEPKFEKPVFAKSNAIAVEELRSFFAALLGSKDYSSSDVVVMRGPNSQIVVYEGSIAELLQI